MKTIMIIGASGLIGQNVVNALIEEGHTIIGIGNQNLSPTAVSDNYTYHKLDLVEDQDSVQNIIFKANADILIHLGCSIDNDLPEVLSANDLDYSEAINKYLYRSAEQSGIKEFFLLSTHHVYGKLKKNKMVSEDFCGDPYSIYGKLKYRQEQSLIQTANNSNCYGVIMRVCPIYSKEYLVNLKANIYDLNEGCGVIYGDGKYQISLTSILNIVDFIRSIIRNDSIKECQGIYNICDSISYSALDILSKLRENGETMPIMQKKKAKSPSLFSVSDPEIENYRYINPSILVRNITYDISRAKKYIPFSWTINNI